MDDTEQLLQELAEAKGVTGYEKEVRDILRRELEPIGIISQDKIGSLICRKRGSADEPRVVLAAHMDEIGFMARYITEEGFIKFTSLGGWWDQVLLAQRVLISTHKGDVIGVIGAKPPHLLTEEERKKVVLKKDMYVDIGATSKQEVEQAGVRVGDPIIPVSEFTVLANPRTYMCKAFDDRIGCALLVTAMQRADRTEYPNTLFGVATAQEEVGARGATTSVDQINPDVAIVLEVDIAGDVPGIKPEETAIKLGHGPVLLVHDTRMIPNLKLRDLTISTAKQCGIALQVCSVEGGATDGGSIHLHGSGVPTVVVGVPTRHIHCHNAIIHRDDFDRTVELLTQLIRQLDRKTVEDLTAW
jgi:endoglucanase